MAEVESEPIRLGFNLAEPNPPNVKEGFICEDDDCPTGIHCSCGAGWVALECDAIEDRKGSIGTMQKKMKPGSCFVVCKNNHRKMYKLVPEDPSYMELLLDMTDDLLVESDHE